MLSLCNIIFKKIDSNTSQKIATRLWKAFDELLYGNGKQIHFKKFGECNSLEGKTNKAGIRYKDGYLLWNGLSLQVIYDQNNSYELEAFQNEEKCISRFEEFLSKHHIEIKRCKKMNII